MNSLQLWQLMSFSCSSGQQNYVRRETGEWTQLPQDEISSPRSVGENNRLLEGATAANDVSDDNDGEEDTGETNLTSSQGHNGSLVEDSNGKKDSRRPRRGTQQGSSSGYGAMDNGDRSAALVPSGLGSEAEAWR